MRRQWRRGFRRVRYGFDLPCVHRRRCLPELTIEVLRSHEDWQPVLRIEAAEEISGTAPHESLSPGPPLPPDGARGLELVIPQPLQHRGATSPWLDRITTANQGKMLLAAGARGASGVCPTIGYGIIFPRSADRPAVLSTFLAGRRRQNQAGKRRGAISSLCRRAPVHGSGILGTTRTVEQDGENDSFHHSAATAPAASTALRFF